MIRARATRFQARTIGMTARTTRIRVRTIPGGVGA